MSNTYYLVRKQQLMREFYQAMKSAEQVLVSRYGSVQTESIIQQTRQEFESLLFRLPYIAGMIPVDRHADPIGPVPGDLSRVEKLWQAGGRDRRGVLPHDRAALCNSHVCWYGCRARTGSIAFRGPTEAAAVRSQEREYPALGLPGVDGDGKNFDYGVDYTECAICKSIMPRMRMNLSPMYACWITGEQSAGHRMTRTTTWPTVRSVVTSF